MVGIYKAKAIRLVGTGTSLTNQQVKDAVLRDFGLVVESNQINGLLGPEYRRKNAALILQLEDLARRLLLAAGGLGEAKRILSLVGMRNFDSTGLGGGN